MILGNKNILDCSCICFCTVLSHVHLQVLGLFAGIVALLAGKRFLTSVWKHVKVQTIGLTARVAALLTQKGIFSSVFELVPL